MHLLKTLASSDRRPCPIVSCYIIFLSSKQKNKILIYFLFKSREWISIRKIFFYLWLKKGKIQEVFRILGIYVLVLYIQVQICCSHECLAWWHHFLLNWETDIFSPDDVERSSLPSKYVVMWLHIGVSHHICK